MNLGYKNGNVPMIFDKDKT